MSYPTIVRDCLVCGATYTTTSAARLYCSGKCRGRKCRAGYADRTDAEPDTTKYRDKVLAMLATGDSQREIAKLLNIHRRTVERIKAESLGTVKSDTVFAPFAVEPYRCSGCEAAGVKFTTTWKPCVRCAARKAVAK